MFSSLIYVPWHMEITTISWVQIKCFREYNILGRNKKFDLTIHIVLSKNLKKHITNCNDWSISIQTIISSLTISQLSMLFETKRCDPKAQRLLHHIIFYIIVISKSHNLNITDSFIFIDTIYFCKLRKIVFFGYQIL